jgi:Fic family protein
MSRFEPNYVISIPTANALVRIEAVRQRIEHLPIHPTLLASLRESAMLVSTHYSTMIEGNRLTHDEVEQVVGQSRHFDGRKRDEAEVKGYYAAIQELETLVARKGTVTEQFIQTLHALVMGGGKRRVKPTPYRVVQNVIRDSSSRRIVYMPPEASDVPKLMKQLTVWLRDAVGQNVPCAIRAAIAYYQFATIHPYLDGNGRTARLLTNSVLHLGGYGLKGLYSLEEYYAKNLGAYYEALSIGPSHNYYGGRAKADITPWINYFCQGMANSFEAVATKAQDVAREGASDKHIQLRALDAMQRRCLELFQVQDEIASRDIQSLFSYKPRSATALLSRWVDEGFLVITDPGLRSRKYALAKRYVELLD